MNNSLNFGSSAKYKLYNIMYTTSKQTIINSLIYDDNYVISITVLRYHNSNSIIILVSTTADEDINNEPNAWAFDTVQPWHWANMIKAMIKSYDGGTHFLMISNCCL